VFKLTPFYAIFTAFENKSALFSRRITTNNKLEYKGISGTFVFYFSSFVLGRFLKKCLQNNKSALSSSAVWRNFAVSNVDLGLLHVDQELSKLMRKISVMATLCFPLHGTQKTSIDITAHAYKRRPFIDDSLINKFLDSFAKHFG